MFTSYPYQQPSLYPTRAIPNNYDERFGGFLVPFLLGGLGGAAVVGLSRPRPVYVNPGPPSPYYPYNPYNPYYR